VLVLDVQSIEELRQVSAEQWVPVQARGGRDFNCRLAVEDLGGEVAVNRAQSRPSMVSHPDRVTDRDLLFFRVHLGSPGRLRQYGREVDLADGSGVLFESRGEWEQFFPADSESMNLQFPRELLPSHSAEIADLCGRAIPSDAPGTRLFLGYLNQLHAMAGELSVEQRRDAGQALIELLGMALRGVGSASVGDGPDAVLQQVMREYVREHSGDVRLTVDELARRHHLSVRRLYAVFGAMDVTPAAFIREQRLAGAKRLLLDRRYDRRSIAGIAELAGFGEMRTFERAFRREYGVTPGRWRREHRDSRTSRSW
jgi:AraC-like DNA-binding protein